jgi:carbamate kinase
VRRAIVIAIGGNALIRDGQRGTIDEQAENARETAQHIGAIVDAGWRVVVTHGNGPQVGFILMRSELLSDSPVLPRLSLDMAVADSQGGLGYIIGNAVSNDLSQRGYSHPAVCLMTRTQVDPADAAFHHPSKPIGPAFSPADARERTEHAGWSMVEDAGRGYRRVVASPRPQRILETEAIRSLLEAGFLVIACGGGGIPVVEVEPGVFRGVEAVIDKDFASALLGASLGAQKFVLSTGVQNVAIRYRQPDQRNLDRVTVSELRRHLVAGEFPEGSMGPKIRAAIDFIERGGEEVIITSPGHLQDAIAGQTGTHVVPD